MGGATNARHTLLLLLIRGLLSFFHWEISLSEPSRQSTVYTRLVTGCVHSVSHTGDLLRSLGELGRLPREVIAGCGS